MKGVWMLAGNFKLNPKRDRSGRSPSFFWPLKETMLKHRQYTYFVMFSSATLNETFTAKYDGVLPRTPKVRPKSEIYTPKRNDEHPHPFHMRNPPPGTLTLTAKNNIERIKAISVLMRRRMCCCVRQRKQKLVVFFPFFLKYVMLLSFQTLNQLNVNRDYYTTG